MSVLAIDWWVLPAKYEKKITKELGQWYSCDDAVFTESDAWKNDENLAMYKVVDAGKSIILGTILLAKANACKPSGCTNTNEIHKELEGNYEKFYYVVAYNNQYNILGIRMLEYESDYGYEIASRSWLRQFVGKISGQIKYKNDIDGISGATISVKSLIENINNHRMYLDIVQGDGLAK